MAKKKLPTLLFMWLRCLTGYTFHILSSLLFLTLLFPLHLILLPFGKVTYFFLNTSMHAYLAFLTRVFLPGLKIYDIKEISGFKLLPNDKPLIFVANHSGKLDGPFLLGILTNTVAIMKSKYATMPVYSKLVKNLDFINLEQHSYKALEEAISRTNKVLTKGKRVLIFPEGTRSSPKKILPFKEFAFRIARQNNISVVPVVIYCDFALMAKTIKSYFPSETFSVVIRCLSPVTPLENELPVDMAARVRKIMVKEMAAIEKHIQ